MTRERRLQRAVARLRGRGHASVDPEADLGATDPDPEPGQDELQPSPPSELESDDTSPIEPAADEGHLGIGSLNPGDLDEGRRESLARRLRELRGRVPTRPRRTRGAGPVTTTNADRRSRARARASGLRAGAGVVAGAAGAGLTRGLGAVGRGTAAAGKGIGVAGARTSKTWKGLPLVVRQRIAAGVLVVAMALLIVVVVVPATTCGDDCPPPDDAIGLVPADALAYAHVDIGTDDAQFQQLSSFAGKLPLLSGLLGGSLTDVGGTPVDFASQVEPWAGSEAATAILPASGGIGRVTMIAVDDPDGARSFVAGVLGPELQTGEIDGIEVSMGSRRSAAALVDGFLLLGSVDSLTRMIEPDPEVGKLESVAGAALTDDLPAERAGYAYLSADGARTLLAAPGASSLETFVDSGATTGVAVALSFSGDLASLTIRSSLDPASAATSPSFFAALPPFEPGLTRDVGADALAYLGLGDPGRSVASLLRQAATSAPGLLSAYNATAETLRREGGISVADDLLPLLGSEAALSVEPVAGSKQNQPPGVLTPAGVPYVSLLADGVDSPSAAASLAALQDSLVSALAPSGGEAVGQVPVFEPLQIAGIEAQSLTVSPNVQLTYATYDDRLAVATDPLGIAQARSGGAGLADSSSFREVTDGLPRQASLLAYLDLRDLLSLGEQVGLATDPSYVTLASDLRKLDAAALSVTASDDLIRTDLRLAIGEGDPAQPDAPLVSGE